MSVNVESPPVARRRAGALWVIGVSLAIAAVISLFALLAVSPDENATMEGLSGVWVSTSDEAPGTLILNADGTARLEHLTAFDTWADPKEKIADNLSADGTWSLHGYNLQVRPDPAGPGPELFPMIVYKSAIVGNTIEMIVGDPDGPRFVQEFKRSDSR
ncbi:hypothetical protein [Microbacterium sp. SSM24]|uniref:hypothetical protein n=1 Tax=Microbacterium sp. SSM24 TaxID=2991714 RepID=UPI002225FF54|nr:hypothetical protein [Microbacterium sp. SSM24]MCW3493233.1 hypothetical protein [Microbacterium sp. SSM24]